MSPLHEVADLAGLMLRGGVRIGLLLDKDGMELAPSIIEDLADLHTQLDALRYGRALPPPVEPEGLPYSFADRVCAEHRARHRPPPGSSVRTEADLSRQLQYFEGFPEAQKAAREVFRLRRRRVAA